jgi:NAD(P)-dependent dehydrogenase (short-subunit alcohol dehydrogenase family)
MSGERPADAGRLLVGKVAIITGASRGIGAAAARVFARAGASVVLAARSEEPLVALAREIVSAGGRALAVPTDVGEPEAMRQLVERTVSVFGRLDAAFNNAGEGHPKLPLAAIALEDFDRSVRTNVRGIFLAMKEEIPAMLASGGGAIVNMSSTAGLSGVQGMSGYVAGKHGIAGLTKSAALDYAAQGVRVNAVAPGPILTERLSGLPEPYRAPVIASVPVRRLGSPEEVGALAAWLCSDQASFLTGAVIPIDGGRMAAGA